MRKEKSTAIKQGIIMLIPNSDKDHSLIETWRPVTLWNTDYQMISLRFAKRFLDEITGETQTGFMTDLYISSDITSFISYCRSLWIHWNWFPFTIEHYIDQVSKNLLNLNVAFCVSVRLRENSVKHLLRTPRELNFSPKLKKRQKLFSTKSFREIYQSYEGVLLTKFEGFHDL